MDRFVKMGLVLAAAALVGCEESAETGRRVGGLEQKVASLESDRAELSAEATKLRDASAELARTLGRVEGALAGAAKREADLEGQIADIKKQLAGLAESNESMKQEAASLKKAVAEVVTSGPVPLYPVKPVLKMLGHSDATVRDSAARILRRLADPESIGPLVAIVESRADPATRRCAVQALGAFKKNERVQKALVKLVDDPDANMRRTVYQSMGDIGAGALLDPLLKALDAEKKRAGGRYSYDVQQAASALSKFDDVRAGRAVLKLVAEGDERTSRYVAQSLGRCKSPELVPDVVAYLKKAGEPKPKDNSPPQAYAMQMIARVGGESAAAAVLAGMASPNARLRREAAGALRKVVGKRSVRVLAMALATGEAPTGKAIGTNELLAVIRELTQLGDAGASKTFLVLAKGSDQALAAEAATGLAKCADPKIAANVIAAWKACKPGTVKSRLEAALRSGGYPVHWVEKGKTFAPGPAPAKKPEKPKKPAGPKKAGGGAPF